MMKRSHLLLIALVFLTVCLFLSGCGKTSGGGGSKATIRGQILINGEPAGPDQVIHTVSANDKDYFDAIEENGYFSHGSGELDHEYCVPGKTITLNFIPTGEVAGVFSRTCVFEYVVKKGDNNLGQIDLGLYGFGLVEPEDGATFDLTAEKPTFKWTPYARPGITPEYRLNLNIPFLIFLIPIEKTTRETSVSLTGDEKVTVQGNEYGLKYVKNWSVCVEYQAGDRTIRHYSDRRTIQFPAED